MAGESSQQSPALSLVRDVPWIARDDVIAQALAAHPVLPVQDITTQRNARLAAFVLALQAMPSDPKSSISGAEFTVDSGDLRERLKLSQREVTDALRALWIVGVFESVAVASSRVRFAAAFIAPSGIAPHIKWSVVLERLTAPPRQGTQTALMLFRLLLEQLNHPAEHVAFAHPLAQKSLGVGDEQVRRGVRALIQTGLWEGERRAGQRSRYGLGRAVLVGVPVMQPPETLLSRALSPELAPPQQSGGGGGVDSPGAPPRAAADLVIEIGGRRIAVPSTITDLRLPDAASGAAIEIDPTTGAVRVILS
jgi:hypothetical protein